MHEKPQITFEHPEPVLNRRLRTLKVASISLFPNIPGCQYDDLCEQALWPDSEAHIVRALARELL